MTDSPKADSETTEGGITKAQEEEHARLFLRNQGLVSLMSFACFGAFIYFPNAYVAIGCVLLISAFAKYLESQTGNRHQMGFKDRTVVITGCDTGFGHDLAKELVDLGVIVFAGCLDASGEGADALRALDNPRMHVVQMDVTKEDQIQEVVKFVNKVTKQTGLWGLVNNAGIEVIADIELTSMTMYQKIVDVNQLGMVRVTKAFLPLIRKKQGRIVNITSIKARLPVIHNSAYTMTKFACGAFSDVLRMEMRKFGVKVIIVEPGNFTKSTNIKNPKIQRNISESMWKEIPKDIQTTYGKEYMMDHVNNIESSVKTSAGSSINVINKIIEGLFGDNPKTRYTIGGSNQWYDVHKWRMRLYSFLPDWYMDGFWTHDVRGSLNPADLVGKSHSHSH